MNPSARVAARRPGSRWRLGLETGRVGAQRQKPCKGGDRTVPASSQAVSGGDVAEEAALGGPDGGDPGAQGRVARQRADLPRFACLPEHREAAGSRVRAISAVSSRSPELASSHPGPGRITSPQISSSSPGPQAPALPVAGREPPRRGGEPADERPPASQRNSPHRGGQSSTCSVRTGWLTSQSSTRFRLAARCRCAPQLSSRNGVRSSNPDACSRSRPVAGHRPRRDAAGTAASPATPPARQDRAQTRVKSSDGPSVGGHCRSRGRLRTGPPASLPGSRTPAPGPAGRRRPCPARVERRHARDHVVGDRGQVQLGRAQPGMAEDPLDISQRHVRVPNW